MSNNPSTKIESQILSLESLLNSSSSIQEIFSIGMQSVITIIKSQQSSIKELERQISQKASKSELSSGLNIKANIADIMRTLSEVASNIDNRPTIEDIQLLLDDKVSHNEVNDILSSKPSMEEIRQYLSSNDLKVSLKYHLDDITKNFVTMKEFTEGMNSKANKDNIIAALHKKANKVDLETYIANKPDIDEYKSIIEALNRKVAYDDIEKIHNDIKVSLTKENEKTMKRLDDVDQDLDRLIENIKKQFQSVNTVLNNLTANKADYKEIESIAASFKKQCDSIPEINSHLMKCKEDINNTTAKFKSSIEQQCNDIDKKLKDGFEQYKGTISSEMRHISNDLNKVNMSLDHFINKSEFEMIKNKLSNDINTINTTTQSKAEFNDLDILYKNIQKELYDKLDEHQLSIQEYIKGFDNDIQLLLDKKANLSEMNLILNSKADYNSVSVAIDQKVSNKSFEQFKLTFEQMVNDSLNKVDYAKFDSFINSNQMNIDDIKNELMIKANIKEMINYLKNKADIDDVNKALTQIHDELDIKTGMNDFNHAMDNQNAINDALCQENSLGKWTWESGLVKNGFAIPWENQLINTSPDNFCWEKDKTNILIMTKGIYLISFAFFTNTKPTVQLLVNGDVVLSCVNSNGFVIQQTTKSKMTGMSLCEYLNLPDKARVTISYAGENESCGFLCVKKIS